MGLIKLFATLLLFFCVSPLNEAQKYNYSEVLEKSLLFYEAQRSGELPDSNRVPWRGDSALGDQIPEGYYDAGDHVKFGFPMASFTTVVAWGAITFQSGYEAAGQLQYVKECLKWSTDYFIAAHTAPEEFYGQVGDGYADHAYWGRPEEMTMDRPAFKIDAGNPGSELAGETAAALAASSIFYKNIGDTALADEALTHARQLFDLANNYRGSYVNSIPNAADFYNSWNGYGDELAWSAAWLAKATGESDYLTLAESIFDEFGMSIRPSEVSWDDKIAMTQVLLLELTGSDKYKTCVDNFINYLLYECPYTPKGMIFVNAEGWGSLRHVGNVAHVCAQVARLGHFTSECDTFIENQMNYTLGDGGRSYVVGFGNNPPTHPHHRSSSCPNMPEPCDWDEYHNPGPNYQTLTGALVGGPDANDYYNDARDDYRSNEVATDYNAGFQSAIAYLASRS